MATTSDELTSQVDEAESLRLRGGGSSLNSPFCFFIKSLEKMKENTRMKLMIKILQRVVLPKVGAWVTRCAFLQRTWIKMNTENI
ncbi:MAG TPA: hypothetical protein PKI14_08690 [Fervidobacterium sp.]|nr:hypothetical protein [Fervidobacterium sp.]HUM43012.1 hypothetical protein [Fervidobacterium sp.]